MTYYSMKYYDLLGFEKSKKKGKMYDAILLNKKNSKIKRVPFGSSEYENYRDITGLNLYPHLIHGNNERRRRYRARHKVFLKKGYYSPGLFSFFFLW